MSLEARVERAARVTRTIREQDWMLAGVPSEACYRLVLSIAADVGLPTKMSGIAYAAAAGSASRYKAALRKAMRKGEPEEVRRVAARIVARSRGLWSPLMADVVTVAYFQFDMELRAELVAAIAQAAASSEHRDQLAPEFLRLSGDHIGEVLRCALAKFPNGRDAPPSLMFWAMYACGDESDRTRLIRSISTNPFYTDEWAKLVRLVRRHATTTSLVEACDRFLEVLEESKSLDEEMKSLGEEMKSLMDDPSGD